MNVRKRAYTALIVTVGTALCAVVLFDVYEDWLVEGKPLWSTVLENLIPLGLAVSVIVAGYWLYTSHDQQYLETVARWLVVGTTGIFLVVTWVIGLQKVVQGRLKPRIIVTQITIGGAVAGLLVGYANARRNESLEKARRRLHRFEALFQHAPAEIIDAELHEGTVMVRELNEAFESMFGTDETDVALSELIDHSDERTIDQIRNAIRTDQQLETRVSTSIDGDWRYFQLRVAPYGTDQAYVIYLDVTELEQTQRDLEQTVTRLERSNERLEDFAYISSHDLQEPLRTVSRYAELVNEEHSQQLPESAQAHLDTVVTAAERMSAMINGLLDYLRVTTRGDEFESVDVESVVEGVVRDLQVLMEEENGSISVRELPTIEADRDQLWQVFQNLLKNALEHSGEEPVEITVSAMEIEDGYRFLVEDDGPGIDPYMQEDVFDMFESGQNFQTEGDARGIGLAVVQRIIDRHNGDIWVESEPGKGSSFYFTIPEIAENVT